MAGLTSPRSWTGPRDFLSSGVFLFVVRVLALEGLLTAYKG